MSILDNLHHRVFDESELPDDFLERLIYVIAPDWLDERRQHEFVSVARLGLISLTRDSIMHQARQKQGVRFPKRIRESDFPEEFDELLDLGQKIEYSPAYYQFLENTRDITLSCIEEDHRLVDCLAAWSFLNKQERKLLLRHLHALQNSAASFALDQKFTRASFDYYSKAKAIDPETRKPFVLYGRFFHHHKNGRSYKHIEINTHADANFDDVIQASKTGYHENTHAHQFELGRMYRRGVKLGALAYDGLISSFRSTLGATIPSSIYLPYRAQFHEVAAFRAGNRFAKELCAILGQPSSLLEPTPDL